jgi:Putative adhesin
MPTFDTPAPIHVTIKLGAGDLRITAGDRSDTVAEVRPSDDANSDDVRAAEQTRVEYADGRLLVQAPKSWKRYSPFSDGGSVDVTIELPAGSQVQGDAAMAALRCEGRMGDCRLKTSAGDIVLGEAGAISLSTTAGDITVDRAAGNAEVTTASGDVRIGTVDGTAVIKNSNGDSWVGEAAGDVRLVGANGDIAVDRASGGVTAKTANGSVRVGEVVRGSVVLETAFGDVGVGIGDGTAAKVDASTHYGSVRNEMDASEGPEPSDETAEIYARTAMGDIVIHRS